MKFIYVDEGACSELISERVFQSPEFELGKLLISIVRGTIPRAQLTIRCSVLSAAEGVYLLSPGTVIQNYLVIDMEEASELLTLDDGGLILTLQKTFRYASKYWAGLKPSANERVLTNNKVAIFPYPIGMQTALRVSIDRNPDEKRRSRREAQKAVLVYRFSDNEGGGVTESPRLTNFRRACEGRDNAYALAAQQLSLAAGSRPPCD
jgi:hypothetical protein